MSAANSQTRRIGAWIASVGILVALLWACASPTAKLNPTAQPTVSPSPVSSILEAIASPKPRSSTAPATAGPTFLGPVALSSPRPGVTVTIVAAGDIACDPAHNTGAPQNCDQAATANEIGQLAPTAVLTLGDDQYQDGTLNSFNSVFASTWGAYRSIMYPAIGNHEYLTKGAAGYFGYFGIPAYYSFNLGAWHMIALDSECSFIGGCQAGSPEERWLQADLAANPSTCTLVYWHEPRWSSGEHGDATQMATIWADLVAAHVSVVLIGPQPRLRAVRAARRRRVARPDRVTEFVVGTGGKNHYGFVTPPLTGEVVRNDTSFGVIGPDPGAHELQLAVRAGAQLHVHGFGIGQLRRLSSPPSTSAVSAEDPGPAAGDLTVEAVSHRF